MRVALDSNILVYLSGIGYSDADKAKVARARALIGALASKATVIVPVQALGELFVVLRRNAIDAAQARETVRAFGDAYETPASDLAVMVAASDIAVDHRLQYWDSVILSAAAASGCALLLSEDMQDGFAWRGLTVVNPLGEDVHPRLAALVG